MRTNGVMERMSAGRMVRSVRRITIVHVVVSEAGGNLSGIPCRDCGAAITGAATSRNDTVQTETLAIEEARIRFLKDATTVNPRELLLCLEYALLRARL